MAALRYNNIYQLIQKGDVNRNELLQAVKGMVYTAENKKTELTAKPPIATDGKPKLLVVEDNPDNMLTVKALLSHDFEVIEAVDGNQAVEMAAKHLPNLILMDIALPEMDGIDAFKAIRNNMKLHNIPIIALTASAMVSDREVILAYGFDAYIPKPIDEQVFFQNHQRNTLWRINSQQPTCRRTQTCFKF
jgi:CheY-like chemotaxis protein